jgi:hypothetical protein
MIAVPKLKPGSIITVARPRSAARARRSAGGSAGGAVPPAVENADANKRANRVHDNPGSHAARLRPAASNAGQAAATPSQK